MVTPYPNITKRSTNIIESSVQLKAINLYFTSSITKVK